MITRRKVIVGGLMSAIYGSVAYAATLAPLSPSISGKSKSVAKIPSSVTIVRWGDQSFSSLLDQYFPKLSQNRHFLKMTRSSVLLVNNDARDIYGYRVRWSNKKAGHHPDRYYRRFMNGPTLQLQARQMTAQVPLLTTGGVALITPYFTWSSSSFISKSSLQNFGSRRYKRYVKKNPRAHGIVARGQQADSISVSLEAVAFTDSVAGRKRLSFARVIRNRRNAEHDQAVAISGSVISANDALAHRSRSFVGTLSSDAIRTAPSPVYAKARKRFAERMMHLLNVDPSKGEEVLHEVSSASRSTVG